VQSKKSTILETFEYTFSLQDLRFSRRWIYIMCFLGGLLDTSVSEDRAASILSHVTTRGNNTEHHESYSFPLLPLPE
jgi:hypothetical protein